MWSCHPDWPLRVGSTQSQIKKAAVHRAHTLNVGNLHDTGHLTASTPTAAKADKQMFAGMSLTTEKGPKLRVLCVVHQALVWRD